MGGAWCTALGGHRLAPHPRNWPWSMQKLSLRTATTGSPHVQIHVKTMEYIQIYTSAMVRAPDCAALDLGAGPARLALYCLFSPSHFDRCKTPKHVTEGII